jgi:ATP-dependent Clp protease ATP-binding subunit ClpC
MTSNIGVRQLKDFGQGVGFATKAREESADNDAKNIIHSALKRTFSPEFLNRIDDVVVFNSLDQNDIFKIIDITLKDLYARIEKMGYSLTITEGAKKFVSERGYDPQFGARPLNRAIQKYIEDPLAEFILSNNPEQGIELKAVLNKAKNGLTIKSGSEVASKT